MLNTYKLKARIGNVVVVTGLGLQQDQKLWLRFKWLLAIKFLWKDSKMGLFGRFLLVENSEFIVLGRILQGKNLMCTGLKSFGSHVNSWAYIALWHGLLC